MSFFNKKQFVTLTGECEQLSGNLSHQGTLVIKKPVHDATLLDTEFFYVGLYYHITGDAYKIPTDILDAIRNGNGYLVIDLAHDGFSDSKTFDKIYNVCEKLNISPLKTIYTSSALNVADMHRQYVTETGITACIHTHACNHWLIHSYTNYVYHQPIISAIHNANPAHKDKFVSFNRVRRPHRMMLAVMLHAQGLLEQGYVSYLDQNYEDALPFVEEYENLVDSYPGLIHYKSKVTKFAELLPLILDTSLRTDEDELNRIFASTQQYYMQSRFEIVTESNWQDSYFVTEKTYRPIMLKMPFLLVSGRNDVARLRDVLGFRSFSPYIDESYDEALRIDQRIEMVVKETKKLLDMPQNEYIQWKNEVNKITEFNFNKYLELATGKAKIN